MPRVQFTRHLNRFFPGLSSVEVEAGTVAEVVRALERLYPGLASYLVEDQGALRRHVNIFVEGVLIQDRIGLSDPLSPDSEVDIMQALSGG